MPTHAKRPNRGLLHAYDLYLAAGGRLHADVEEVQIWALDHQPPFDIPADTARWLMRRVRKARGLPPIPPMPHSQRGRCAHTSGKPICRGFRNKYLLALAGGLQRPSSPAEIMAWGARQNPPLVPNPSLARAILRDLPPAPVPRFEIVEAPAEILDRETQPQERRPPPGARAFDLAKALTGAPLILSDGEEVQLVAYAQNRRRGHEVVLRRTLDDTLVEVGANGYGATVSVYLEATQTKVFVNVWRGMSENLRAAAYPTELEANEATKLLTRPSLRLVGVLEE